MLAAHWMGLVCVCVLPCAFVRTCVSVCVHACWCLGRVRVWECVSIIGHDTPVPAFHQSLLRRDSNCCSDSVVSCHSPLKHHVISQHKAALFQGLSSSSVDVDRISHGTWSHTVFPSIAYMCVRLEAEWVASSYFERSLERTVETEL